MTIPAYLPQQANIKAYYALENINDNSGNGYNLTNENTVTFTAAKFANGANFGSSNSNKALSIIDGFGIQGGAITILMWVKCLAEIGSGTWCTCYQYDINVNGVIYELFYQYNAGTRRISANRRRWGIATTADYTNITMGTSIFHHIGLIYDNTKIYSVVNGVVSGGTAATGTGNTIGSKSFGIGRGTDGAPYASILADECVIWNIALTSTEVLKAYSGWQPKAFFMFL